MARFKKPKLEEHNTELDMAPMLAMMVALIPVLLLSTAFVKVMMIESPLPQIIAEAIAQDKANGERHVEVTLDVEGDKSLKLSLSVNQKEQKWTFKPDNGEFPIDNLREELIRIKRNHPRTFRLTLNPSTALSYKEIVKIMDSVRDSQDPAIQFSIQDQKTGETAQTTLLFPEVVFGNVAEG